MPAATHLRPLMTSSHISPRERTRLECHLHRPNLPRQHKLGASGQVTQCCSAAKTRSEIKHRSNEQSRISKDAMQRGAADSWVCDRAIGARVPHVPDLSQRKLKVSSLRSTLASSAAVTAKFSAKVTYSTDGTTRFSRKLGQPEHAALCAERHGRAVEALTL